jgi:copper chaperone
MEKLQLKTNINCSGCVAKVTPFLDSDQRIAKWSVDTLHPRKLLTVETGSMTPEELTDLLARAGFKGEIFMPDR